MLRRFLIPMVAVLLLAACQQVRPPAVETAAVEASLAADLFFSEYVEGSSNNKALEIFNGTGAAVDLGASSYNVQMFFNGNMSAGLTINLIGTVAAGDVFVLAQASAEAAILAEADQTNGAGWYNGDDAVVLRKGTTVLDVIGQIGVDPGTQWGTDLTSTADNTLRRLPSVCAGDPDGSDAFDPSAQWTGFDTNATDGLGTHDADCAPRPDLPPTVVETVPADGDVDVDPEAPLIVTFSEAVALADAPSLSCELGGATVPIDFTVDGGPTTYAIVPTAMLEPFAICTLTVMAAGVVDSDGDPDFMEADVSVIFTVGEVVDVCAAAYAPIYAIQGSGSTAAITGPVTTQGVVVGDFEGPSPALRGFYLQDPDGDGDPATSDGIFVFNGNADSVSVGDLVRVEGTAGEFFGMTQISNGPVITACGTGSVEPTPVTLPVSSIDDFERYEGMLVTFPQDLVISDSFNFGRYGEIVLAWPPAGLDRPFQPTAYVEPGPAAADIAADSALARITLDDARTNQNPTPPLHPNGDPFTLDNRFRGGDLVTDAVGIIDYRFDVYRLQPTAPPTYTAANPRPEAPDDTHGELTVAAFNVLNYFSTLDDAGTICGPLGDQGCRGADNAEEFDRQRSKIIAAIDAIDADVVGLMEIENGAAALADLVDGLNAAAGAGTYAAIETGPIGPDVIRVALIYQPARVAPLGGYAVLDTPEFLDPLSVGEAKNRPALAQTFAGVGGGAATVVVNHLKSKGSDCGEGDDDPIQGNCNLTRTLSAERLLEWIATDPTGAQDPDYLLIGDFNAYDEEDPIAALEAGGLTDLLEAYQGEFAYTYVFRGLFGHLDYAFSTSTLTAQVTGATAWAINADEPTILGYDTEFKQPEEKALFAPDPYRSSDHDPVIVGLALNAAPICSDATASVTELWAPDHSLVAASVLGVTDPEGDAVEIVIDAIHQDEPVNAEGDGDTVPDGFIGMGNAFEVRAERAGTGNGRVYHVSFTASDATGACSGTVTIDVPANQRPNGVAIDDGPLYDSTQY